MVSPSANYKFEVVEGAVVDSLDDLPTLNSQDMNIIYDYNSTGKINTESKTPLTSDGVQTGSLSTVFSLLAFSIGSS